MLGRPGEDYREIPNTWEAQVEYLWLFTHAELVPQMAMLRHFELLTEKVLPHFTEQIR